MKDDLARYSAERDAAIALEDTDSVEWYPAWAIERDKIYARLTPEKRIELAVIMRAFQMERGL